jgi:Protein of unknown function (DUF2721)
MLDSQTNLFPILQVSLGPVILISGVGLLLLSMTNRFGRAIDRTRILAKEIKSCKEEVETNQLKAQMKVLYERAKLMRLVIFLASFSIFAIAITILSLFAGQVFKVDLQVLIEICFISCLVSLITSLIGFSLDISLSLKALKLETNNYL